MRKFSGLPKLVFIILTAVAMMQAIKTKAQGQYIAFTQWQRARTFLNPAYAGYTKQLYVNSGLVFFQSNSNSIKGSAIPRYLDVEYYHQPAKIAISIGLMDIPFVNYRSGDPVISPTYHVGLSRSIKLTDSTQLRVGVKVSMTHQDFRFAYNYYYLTSVYLKKFNVFNASVGMMLVNRWLLISASASSFYYEIQKKDELLKSLPGILLLNTHLDLKPITIAGNPNWKWSMGALYSRYNGYTTFRTQTCISYLPVHFILGYAYPNGIMTGTGLRFKHFSLFYTRDIVDNKLSDSYYKNELNLAVYFQQIKKKVRTKDACQ